MSIHFIEIDPELMNRFIDAARFNNVSTITDMLNIGMPVDIANERGKTALMFAASKGHTDVVRLLLQKGADVNKACPRGWTALHEAGYSKNCDVIRELLQQGASRGMQSDRGATPADLAYGVTKYMSEAYHLLKDS